jgi:hypothetical protein
LLEERRETWSCVFSVEVRTWSSTLELDFGDDVTVRDLLLRLPWVVSRRLRWVGHVAGIEESRYACGIFVEQTVGKQ